MNRWSSHAGLSLVEVTVILTAMGLLGAVFAPVGKGVADRARVVRAGDDERAIGHAILQLLSDTGKRTIRTSGATGFVVELLVGNGDTSAELDAAGDPRWIRPVGAGGVVDFLERHLSTNDPGGDAANAWTRPAQLDGVGWRGAYVAGPIGPDPWGGRYAVNVAYLGTTTDVVVLSGGPDEVIATAFEGSGLVAVGDDVSVLVR